jgi:hypothetical protein
MNFLGGRDRDFKRLFYAPSVRTREHERAVVFGKVVHYLYSKSTLLCAPSLNGKHSCYSFYVMKPDH